MKFSDLKIIQRESGTAILKNGSLEVAQIACNGNDDVISYEADAREAAELLKQFFEAKAAGKEVQLVVYGATNSSLAWQEGYQNGRAEARDEIEKCTCGPYQVCSKQCDRHGYQRPKNTVIDEMNTAGDKATAGIDMLRGFSEKELQDYKALVDGYYNQKFTERLYPENFNATIQPDKHERHARQQIGNWAVRIYTKNKIRSISAAYAEAVCLWRLTSGFKINKDNSIE